MIQRSGLILAGGHGERFGGYKATALFLGKPLIFWPMAAMEGLVQETIIAHGGAKNRKALETIGIEASYVSDGEEGPLGGLLHGARAASGDWVVVAPSDMPLVSKELFEVLISGSLEVDACVPRPRGIENPVLGTYRRKALLRTAATVLKEGESSVFRVLRRLEAHFIDEDVLRRMPYGLDCQFDIDTHQDLAKAEEVARRFRKELGGRRPAGGP